MRDVLDGGKALADGSSLLARHRRRSEQDLRALSFTARLAAKLASRPAAWLGARKRVQHRGRLSRTVNAIGRIQQGVGLIEGDDSHALQAQLTLAAMESSLAGVAMSSRVSPR
eukprot:CAMPEP_0115844930 /NCGR_PEP_ID=MMETSP0287-20121206/9081_1 /TAXON_ID=412157 /ORGANISM="Chrysochromulina rotalis, Strain UIO044" /LENGTH=112 /DNA_ID=CAMNT_0003298669 /DNA_START=24 /DNA_END=359 /DNA_ORIENTATION=-